jgi:uncharacterized protein YoxC
MGHKKLVDIITKFEDCNKSITGTKAEDFNQLKSAFNELNGKVQYLESVLAQVAKIGTALKKENIGDSNVMKLAEKLASIQTNEKENSQVN